jgi:hypothetical protein
MPALGRWVHLVELIESVKFGSWRRESRDATMRLCRGVSGADLLVMAAFTKAPKVLRCEALDALRLHAQGFKRLVGGGANGDILSLQRDLAFIPATQ